MNPNGVQFSIDYPFSDNTVVCPGLTLPRSFTLACHGKQVYGVSSNLSIAHSRTSNLGLFSLASIWGNSRALVLAIIRRNQTRILFVWDYKWAFFRRGYCSASN